MTCPEYTSRVRTKRRDASNLFLHLIFDVNLHVFEVSPVLNRRRNDEHLESLL